MMPTIEDSEEVHWILVVEFDSIDVAHKTGSYEGAWSEAANFVQMVIKEWSLLSDDIDEIIEWVQDTVTIRIDMIDPLAPVMHWVVFNSIPKKMTLTRVGDR